MFGVMQSTLRWCIKWMDDMIVGISKMPAIYWYSIDGHLENANQFLNINTFDTFPTLIVTFTK